MLQAAGEPYDGEINGWDFRYYDRMVKETTYQVNESKLQECVTAVLFMFLASCPQSLNH
jgi:hypothetical protein